MKKLLFIIALLAVLMPAGIKAQSYFEDTVWTKKTGQIDGFYMVKFSKTDSIIVGHGYEMDLFFDAFTGEEIIRIPGSNEVFFINNDENFIRTNAPRTKYEIFDTKTFQVIDSLENDGIQSTGSIDISKDEKYLITNIPNGIRIFDLETKKILKTKFFPEEPNLIYSTVDYVFFTCNSRTFIGHRIRTYEDPEHPGDEKYYKIYASYNKYDFETMDSIDNFGNSRGMVLSPNCKYYAVATASTDYGVEIYDFNTKQLLRRLPVNGPSLTGIEFSPDDKYIVTSNGPGQNSLIVWNVETGNEMYKYTESSFTHIDLSNNGKYIIISIGRYLDLINTKFTTTIPNNEDGNYPLLYPNPATDYIDIAVAGNRTFKDAVRVYDVLANVVLSSPACSAGTPSEGGHIRLDVSDLVAGVYFVRVGGKMYKFVKL